MGCWHGYLSGVRFRLAIAYGPADATATHCLLQIQIGFTFLVPADPGSPRKGPLIVCVCVCVCVCKRNVYGFMLNRDVQKRIFTNFKTVCHEFSLCDYSVPSEKAENCDCDACLFVLFVCAQRKRLYRYPATFFFLMFSFLSLAITVLLTPVPPRPKNTNRKSYLASQMQHRCSDDRKCPKSPLAPTDFGTHYGDVAITRIRVLLCF